ncbi:MAG: twin-arginine translocase TatA/TatE family subunit [Thaumarchaeota archaeon]|nr:twin-arginine translocase TatA/TatE family subunit [Nitrososphaerota archaeon]
MLYLVALSNTHILIIPGLGSTELVFLIVIVVLLLFGAKKIPELARSMGKAKGEFEKGKVESAKETEKLGKKDSEEEREKLEKAARALGIDVEGKSLEELREAIKKMT